MASTQNPKSSSDLEQWYEKYLTCLNANPNITGLEDFVAPHVDHNRNHYTTISYGKLCTGQFSSDVIVADVEGRRIAARIFVKQDDGRVITEHVLYQLTADWRIEKLGDTLAKERKGSMPASQFMNGPHRSGSGQTGFITPGFTASPLPLVDEHFKSRSHDHVLFHFLVGMIMSCGIFLRCLTIDHHSNKLARSKMDYLTILVTRSLLFFSAGPTSRPQRSCSPSLSGPTTPKTAALLLLPAPIQVSIDSIVHSDTGCAHFLLQHVLRHSSLDKESADRDQFLEAKELVWAEMDRASAFARAVGQWFAVDGNQKMDEKQLDLLARRYELRLHTQVDMEMPAVAMGNDAPVVLGA